MPPAQPKSGFKWSVNLINSTGALKNKGPCRIIPLFTHSPAISRMNEVSEYEFKACRHPKPPAEYR